MNFTYNIDTPYADGGVCVNFIGGFLGENLLRVYAANWK
jgi:hypothetical protein